MAILTDKQFLIVGAVVVVGGFFAVRKAEKVVEAVNPTNNENIFNSAFNWLYQKLPGADENTTLGTDIADAEQAIIEMIRGE